MIALSPLVRVVDDDASFCRAISRVLDLAGYRVRRYASAGDFLLDQESCEAPGCIILDLRMPGPSGLELQDALARRGDNVPIVYLSGRADVPSTARAMKAGAVDFLTKPVDRRVLLAAVRDAVAIDVRRRAERAKRIDLETRYASLTVREQDVMRGVVKGRLNKQIAVELGMAERTVKWHRAQMMEKMNAETLADLVDAARDLRSRTLPG